MTGGKPVRSLTHTLEEIRQAVQDLARRAPAWKVVGPTSADYTATAGDLVLVDPTTRPVNVTLPKAADYNVGREITVKNIINAMSIFQITPQSGDLIDSFTLVQVASPLASITFVSNGKDRWYMIG